jgi:hypothetical protein
MLLFDDTKALEKALGVEAAVRVFGFSSPTVAMLF